MVICVRTRNCSAFNFRSEDGMCMLHPAYTKKECMVQNFTEGLEYVHMTNKSDSVRPWRGLRTKDHYGNWTTNPSTRVGIPFMRSSLSGKRFVARIIYKGLYIPGYTERLKNDSKWQHKMVFATPLSIVVKIYNIWYSRIRLISYKRNYRGYWPDGRPLYIASVNSLRPSDAYMRQ